VSHGRSHGISRLFLHRDGERVDDARCRAAELPSGNCSQQPCSGYSWVTGEWCTAHIANPCAPIVLQREAKCTDAARNVVPEFLCTGAVPETQKSFTCAHRTAALPASPQHALLVPSVQGPPSQVRAASRVNHAGAVEFESQQRRTIGGDRISVARDRCDAHLGLA
jgi:hypothetical protein